jgi:hypothetical protein
MYINVGKVVMVIVFNMDILDVMIIIVVKVITVIFGYFYEIYTTKLQLIKLHIFKNGGKAQLVGKMWCSEH